MVPAVPLVGREAEDQGHGERLLPGLLQDEPPLQGWGVGEVCLLGEVAPQVQLAVGPRDQPADPLEHLQLAKDQGSIATLHLQPPHSGELLGHACEGAGGEAAQAGAPQGKRLVPVHGGDKETAEGGISKGVHQDPHPGMMAHPGQDPIRVRLGQPLGCLVPDQGEGH